MPAAILCAEPLPRVAFPSGEYGTERAKGLGRGWGQAGWQGKNSGSGEHPSPGLSTQHQGPTACPPSPPPLLVTPLVSPVQGWGGGATGLGWVLVAAGRCKGLRGRCRGRGSEAGWHPNAVGSGSWGAPQGASSSRAIFGTHLAPRGLLGATPNGGKSCVLGGTGHRVLPERPAKWQRIWGCCGMAVFRQAGAVCAPPPAGLCPPKAPATTSPSPCSHSENCKSSFFFFPVSVAGGDKPEACGPRLCLRALWGLVTPAEASTLGQ